jgi:serine/threonine-protein kinase
MIGTTVGKYRILERLGRGGMGIVYKALDETLDREVAIKVLNPDVDDEELLKRFRGEAISLARLNHPGIATIYELHRHGDEMLMVMEYVRGETLQGLSERMGPLEPPQAAHICVQVLNALAHAHRAGIVHRDLKPANVMITDAGVVKVMDFGIARMLGGEHVTHAGFMMGTPAYMAPEQVLGQDVDGRADLYSVGVLFYRLLTRELPFQADTAIAMAQKQVAEAPTPLGTFRPNLPTWCEAIISRALAKSREERFQTAEAFRAAILMAVAPVPLGDLPTMTLTTPTSSGLLRTSDLNLSGSVATSDAPTVLAGTGELRAAASNQAAAAAATPVSSPIERTGTTVVLGRSHLITLAAMLLLLVAGIGALGYMLLRRADIVPASNATGETTAAPSPAAEPQAASSDTAAAATDAAQPPATPDPARTDAPPATTPPATPTAANPSAASGAIARGDAAAKKPKPLPKETAATAPSSAPPAAAPPTPEPPAAPAVPAVEVAPVTFNAVKMLVQQGNAYRDRDAVLRLEGDRLSVLDKDGKSELLSLPYSVILQAFYSRSKEPKWKGPDGKERTVDVDLGKMSFFRGERNWLILTTQGVPLFIRFEDRDLSAALSAVRQRTGIAIQR